MTIIAWQNIETWNIQVRLAEVKFYESFNAMLSLFNVCLL